MMHGQTKIKINFIPFIFTDIFSLMIISFWLVEPRGLIYTKILDKRTVPIFTVKKPHTNQIKSAVLSATSIPTCIYPTIPCNVQKTTTNLTAVSSSCQYIFSLSKFSFPLPCAFYFPILFFPLLMYLLVFVLQLSSYYSTSFPIFPLYFNHHCVTSLIIFFHFVSYSSSFSLFFVLHLSSYFSTLFPIFPLYFNHPCVTSSYFSTLFPIFPLYFNHPCVTSSYSSTLFPIFPLYFNHPCVTSSYSSTLFPILPLFQSSLCYIFHHVFPLCFLFFLFFNHLFVTFFIIFFRFVSHSSSFSTACRTQ